jgi:hypothetical protein
MFQSSSDYMAIMRLHQAFKAAQRKTDVVLDYSEATIEINSIIKGSSGTGDNSIFFS